MTTIAKEMKELARKGKKASRVLQSITHEQRKEILMAIAHNLRINKTDIKHANAKDLAQAKEMDLNSALLDRLELNDDRIDGMIKGVEEIAEQPEVVNSFSHEFTNEAGLTIKRQRVPLGVILMIFESRPNVVVDCAALALKSSNAIILKGGKEAKHSNEILGNIIQTSIEKFIPKETVQVLASDQRELVNELLNEKENIDVVIPRGGHRLIEFVSENAKMPVIAHYNGLCHMYIDNKADLKKASDLVINAKTQRTGVCNAIESLLVHKDVLNEFAPHITKELQAKSCEIRADKTFIESANTKLTEATEQDWDTEYLDNILSIKTVSNIDEAIDHISKHGSFHTEVIVSEDAENQNRFLNQVDASCVMINASSRFNDGGQLGLGAELGISTTKIHAYGPMGAEQMTTSRYVVVGDGHIRA